MAKRTVTVKKQVDIEIDVEVALAEFQDGEIEEEYEARGLGEPEKELSDYDDNEIKAEYHERFPATTSLEAVYEQVRSQGNAAPLLREYIYEHIGRILP